LKKDIGPGIFLYPLPTVLVGALVEGKPNFITIVYCGIIQHNPPLISVTMGKSHNTSRGIKETGVFSVNIPSENMVKVTDHVGTYSSTQIDKSTLFHSFYGKLEKAPMIDECPLTLECTVIDTLDYGGRTLTYVGEIIKAYADEGVLTGGFPDIEKIRPILFSINDNNYYRVGPFLERAWFAGKDYKKTKE